jgi:penicillin-binding protein 2
MDYRERWELKDYLFSRTLGRRILLFHVGLTVVLLGFLLDFWYLQGVHGEEYAGLAENNRLRRIPLAPTRGEIFDRNDEIIASTRPSLDLVLRREGRRDLRPQLERLAPILGVPAQSLYGSLESIRGRPLFEPLVVREDVKLAELARIEVRREDFPSAEVRQHERRHYPERGLVAHAVGYVGEVSESQLSADGEAAALERGDIVGKSGIERAYDDPLRGVRGWMVVSVNSVGRQVGEARVLKEPGHGSPVRVTLDLRLQRALLAALGDETGAGVFLDPHTGEVLAMVSTPVFDPNLFADGISHDAWEALSSDPERRLHDRAIASFYAPGSTFKVLMAIAGLESGAITPHERVFCNGSTVIYGRTRLCWKKGGHGWVDVEQALAHSCNVFFYKLGQALGIEAIHDFGQRFGLGAPSGVDIPGEEPGILPSDEWKRAAQGEPWYPGDTISVAIGQGLLAVTPIQMARMMSAVATGGRLPTPHLMRDREVVSREVAISERTLDIVRGALSLAVEEGTGRRATRGRFTVAGKTGTAQVFKHSAGIDADRLPKEERDHAWFVGYAPADRPRVAFAVVVEHGGHGGTLAAPIARAVLEAFFDDGSDEPLDKAGGDLRARATAGEDARDVRTSTAR